ncbi:hypothetical protein BROUX41_000202 [Berkeleyomyces rouxiae]|uniref:uncharacterized protein n=1 Tax=Berkeleyomyces rouxiae TaxID=2035830 RepID=UPI003B79AE03
MSVASKERAPRLRASCDGCFQAKVKCSKARPVCSRCLTCGIECRYSPSSRAGKPRADPLTSTAYQMTANTQGTGYPLLSPLTDYFDSSTGAMFLGDTGYTSHDMFAHGYIWPPSDMQLNECFAGTDVASGLEFATPVSAAALGATSDELYAAELPWSATSGLPLRSFPELGRVATTASHVGKHNWVGASDAGELPENALTCTTNGTLTSRTSSMHQRSSPSTRQTSGCKCIALLLESLHELYSAAGLESVLLETVLVINKKAVSGCAIMLECRRCVGTPDVGNGSAGRLVQTTATLLATVLGKTLGLYAVAAHMPAHSSPTSPTMASPFAEGLVSGSSNGFPPSDTQVMGPTMASSSASARFPLEFVTGELAKLEAVLNLFREMCAQSAVDPELGMVLVGYLGSMMQSTMAGLNLRRREAGYRG